MGRLLLLPGERVEATVAPAWQTAARPYAAILLLPATGALWWGLLHSAWWQAGSAGGAWRFWHYLYGNPGAAYILAVALVAAAGLALSLAVPRRVAALAATFAVLWVAAVPSLAPWRYEAALPLAFATLAFPALVWTEAWRRSHRLVLTNLRLVSGPVFVRHEDVRDLELRQGWLDRSLDAGVLVAHVRTPDADAGTRKPHGEDDSKRRAPVPVALTRVHPARRVRELAELVIRDATATPYLREKEDLPARRAKAVEALQRR